MVGYVIGILGFPAVANASALADGLDQPLREHTYRVALDVFIHRCQLPAVHQRVSDQETVEGIAVIVGQLAQHEDAGVLDGAVAEARLIDGVSEKYLGRSRER